MKKKRNFTAQKKVEIVREYLENNVVISELCVKYNIFPAQLYKWKKQLFEGALTTFNQTQHRQKKTQRQFQEFKDKLQDKDSLISELVADNIRLKKNLNGEI